MRLIINGQARDITECRTVADLAIFLELPSFGSAVELNGQVVRRAEHADRILHDGDKLEIVRLVGGG
jgi:sulfur carrier protein